MREYFFPLFDEFRRGLRSDERSARNTRALTLCTGMKPSPEGLVAPRAITPASADAGAVSWPFPQALQGMYQTFLLGSTSVSLLTPGTGTLSAVTTYDPSDLTQTKAIPSGGPWQIVDFAPNVWFLSNGSCIVAKCPVFGGKAVVITLTIGAMCRWGNRLVLGGMSHASLFTGTLWTDVIEEWKNYSPLSTFTYDSTAFDARYLLVGAENGGDANNPFFMEMALLGALSSIQTENVKPIILEAFRSGEMQLIQAHDIQAVRAAKPLGSSLVCYTERAVMSIREGEIGPSRMDLLYAAVGTHGQILALPDSHTFITDTGHLYTYRDGAMMHHGYAEFLSGIGANPFLSYDPKDGDIYICGASAGYILTPSGLGRAVVRPTSLFQYNSTTYGITTGSGTVDVIIDAFDMQNRGIKMIQSIELSFHDLTNVKIGVFNAYTNNSYRTVAPRAVNSSGIVHIGVAGIDFKIRITATAGTAGRIDYANLRWKQVDRRNLRGPFATGAGEGEA